jgi:hypothetical protein
VKHVTWAGKGDIGSGGADRLGQSAFTIPELEEKGDRHYEAVVRSDNLAVIAFPLRALLLQPSFRFFLRIECDPRRIQGSLG